MTSTSKGKCQHAMSAQPVREFNEHTPKRLFSISSPPLGWSTPIGQQARVRRSQHTAISECQSRVLAGITRYLLQAEQRTTKSFVGGGDESSSLPHQQYAVLSIKHHNPEQSSLWQGRGKDASLSNLKIIKRRAFVHHKTRTRSLVDKGWDGQLCGFSFESNVCPIYNPVTRKVMVSNNVVFIEASPNLSPPPNARYCTVLNKENDVVVSPNNRLRYTRNYTARIDFNTSLTHNNVVKIKQPSSEELEDIPSRLRQLPKWGLLTDNGNVYQSVSGGAREAHQPTVDNASPPPGKTSAGGAPAGDAAPDGVGVARTPAGVQHLRQHPHHVIDGSVTI